MSIADGPVDDRRREKLFAKGLDALSEAELLAIFLRIFAHHHPSGVGAPSHAHETLTQPGLL